MSDSLTWHGPDTYPTEVPEIPGGSEAEIAAQYLRRVAATSIRDRAGNANSRIGVLHVCSNRGGELMMLGWSRHPQCYNQKAGVLDGTVAQNLVRVRGILCAPEHISQDTNTAKLRTGSHGRCSNMSLSRRMMRRAHSKNSHSN